MIGTIIALILTAGITFVACTYTPQLSEGFGQWKYTVGTTQWYYTFRDDGTGNWRNYAGTIDVDFTYRVDPGNLVIITTTVVDKYYYKMTQDYPGHWIMIWDDLSIAGYEDALILEFLDNPEV